MIQVNFKAYGSYVVDSLYQWDLNQVLEVTGLNLTEAPEVHFSNSATDRAIVRQAALVDHVVSVGIPNSLLQDPLRIFAHIGIYDGPTFKVVEVVEIPVIARKRPLDYQLEDNDQEVYSFKALENDLANRATRAEVAALSARMDTIVANGNKTDGNSELVDVRVGVDGTVYASAGAAVRGQLHRVANRLERVSYELPNNALADITEYQYRASLIRANNLLGPVYGIKILPLAAGEVEFGYLYSNGLHEKLGTLQVVPGEADYYFNEVYENTTDRKLYILAPLVELGLTSQGGVGMWQLADGKFTVYEPGTWELAYGIITSVGLASCYQHGLQVDAQLEGLTGRVSELEKTNANPTPGEIILPDHIHIAAGRQCNLWWSSVSNYEEDGSIYFEAKCDIGLNAGRGFVVNATADMVGDHTLTIQARDTRNRNVLSTKTLTLHVVDPASGAGSKNILMIGDSRTWQSVNGVQGSNYAQGSNKTTTAELKYLCDASEGTTFNFLGTYVSEADETVRNLADSGWTYATAHNAINEAGGIVNYIETSCGAGSGASLDYATIMYGVNDLMDWRANNLGQYDYSTGKIDGVIESAKGLIDAIFSGYPHCKIVLVLEPTTVLNQDGFAYWAGDADRDSHVELELAMKAYRKRLIAEFDNGAYHPNVTLSSAGLWCDRLYGFPYITEKVSARSSVKMVERFVNCVHPHDDGYRQIADGDFSTIKYLESL